MTQEVCTAVGCKLAEHGGLVSLPIVTIAGLVDGVNPCAIGMIVLLLGYLIIFAQKPEKAGKTAFVYISSVFLTYIVVGLFFFEAITRIQQGFLKLLFDSVITGVLLIAGLINIKDGFWPHVGPHLQIPQASKKYLMKWIEKATLPAAVALGVLVTLLETPCSLPLYVGTLTLLFRGGLAYWQTAGYFLYYNFLFILPLIVTALIVAKSENLVNVREWEEKHKPKMKFVMGIVLTTIGLFMMSRLVN